jgi:F-type H+-transporting ATPase subunit delta
MEELAEVYARSLFEVAREEGKLDDVREQIGEFADALSGSRDLQVFLFSPYFSTDEKAEGLTKVVGDADPIVANFLALLVEKHRMPALFRIRQRLERMWQEENKVLPVQITSAVELDESTVSSIGDRIGEKTGRKIELRSSVDPDILGGLVLQVGNNVLDASIRNRLENLRKQVARGAA